MFISPNYRFSDLNIPLSLDDKIKVFEDQILGWHLNTADWIVKSRAKQATHSAYAVMQIILSYFEMIAKYEKGYVGNRKSGYFFEVGIKLVFPQLETRPEKDAIKDLLKILYKQGRCGLYHAGRARSDIIVSWGYPFPIQYDPIKKLLGINPKKMVNSIRQHFKGYIIKLKDASNCILRTKFEVKFDHESKGSA